MAATKVQTKVWVWDAPCAGVSYLLLAVAGNSFTPLALPLAPCGGTGSDNSGGSRPDKPLSGWNLISTILPCLAPAFFGFFIRRRGIFPAGIFVARLPHPACTPCHVFCPAVFADTGLLGTVQGSVPCDGVGH
jgi:hypothetical protein